MIKGANLVTCYLANFIVSGSPLPTGEIPNRQVSSLGWFLFQRPPVQFHLVFCCSSLPRFTRREIYSSWSSLTLPTSALLYDFSALPSGQLGEFILTDHSTVIREGSSALPTQSSPPFLHVSHVDVLCWIDACVAPMTLLQILFTCLSFHQGSGLPDGRDNVSVISTFPTSPKLVCVVLTYTSGKDD